MAEYYFTMARNQIVHHFPESDARGGCVKVTALDEGHARKAMTEKYGMKWSFQYDDLEKVHEADRAILDEVVATDSDSYLDTSSP